MIGSPLQALRHWEVRVSTHTLGRCNSPSSTTHCGVVCDWLYPHSSLPHHRTRASHCQVLLCPGQGAILGDAGVGTACRRRGLSEKVDVLPSRAPVLRALCTGAVGAGATWVGDHLPGPVAPQQSAGVRFVSVHVALMQITRPGNLAPMGTTAMNTTLNPSLVQRMIASASMEPETP